MAESNAPSGAKRVGGTTPRINATYTRAQDNTGAYTIGDAVMDTTTAASALPIIFSMVDATRLGKIYKSGRISAVRAVITPASGNLVIANCDLDLILFRPATSIPFAAAGYPGDNVALAVSAAAFKQVIGTFRFSAASWRSPAGSVTVAGLTGFQRALPFAGNSYDPFNLENITSASTIPGLVQAQSAWNPGNIAQELFFSLDIDVD